MLSKWGRTPLLFVCLAALESIAVSAQTDVAASLFGSFNSMTSGNVSLQNPSLIVENGNNTEQSRSNAAGVLIEVRHIKNSIIGYEGAYSFNQANQAYHTFATYNAACDLCDGTILNNWVSVSSRSHEFTGAWVASIKARNLRAFILAGGGALANIPCGGYLITSTTSVGPIVGGAGSTFSRISTSTSIKPLLVLGGGVDWSFFPRVGLRFQLRDKFYRAPDPANLFNSSSAFTHSEEPMIGIFVRI